MGFAIGAAYNLQQLTFLRLITSSQEFKMEKINIVIYNYYIDTATKKRPKKIEYFTLSKSSHNPPLGG